VEVDRESISPLGTCSGSKSAVVAVRSPHRVPL